MKSTFCLTLAVLLFAGCATTTPRPDPPLISAGGHVFFVVPIPLDTVGYALKPGDEVAYRDGQAFVVGRVLSSRGQFVYRVTGGDFVLMDKSNYVGRAYRVGEPK